MQTATPPTGTMTLPESPIDDATYNVMMALASKLEAIDVYRQYATTGTNPQIWTRLAAVDRRHADLLLEELRTLLTQNR